MSALSYVSGAGTTPLLGQTIGENLRSSVERFGDSEAVVAPHQGFRATYQEFWDLTTRVAGGLLARGVRPGDRVGIWAPNRYEWVILQYATARMGAILVNVNPAYRASELEYVLRQSGTSLLVLSQGFRQTDYVSILEKVRPDCPELSQSLVIEDDWDDLLSAGTEDSLANLAAVELELQFDDPINIQYTSGTTGFPKGATLTHHNILNNGFFVGEAVHYTHQDRVCLPVHFYHCFGMVLGNLACTSHGACIVIPGEAYDPAVVLETVQTERCTSLYGVPTMFIGELGCPRFTEFDLSTLRTGIMAGSPCPVEVMKKVQSQMHMPEVTIAYGMTETSPVSSQSSTDDPLDKRVSTVGRVLPHLEVKIIDPITGNLVERNTGGELCTRGYSVMLGYWNNPEATAEAIDEHGWMHTGDLGTIDDDDYVNIVGRIKDMIIRGGENIYPREIEDYLYRHPDISDVQVIGVPSERYGEELMAWIKLKEGASVTTADLEAFCRGQVASYKIPRYWKIVDDFPMTVTGKIQKFKMREMAIEELDLRAASTVATA